MHDRDQSLPSRGEPAARPEPADAHREPAVSEASPQRLGLLLADARTRRGLRLADVTAQLGGVLQPAELMALESGAFVPPRETLARLSAVYGVSARDLVPPRDHLVIDTVEGYLRAGQHIALLERPVRGVAHDPGAEPNDQGVGRHDLLSRYLEMIWELRAVEPGSRIPLRDPDLEVLGESLGSAPDDVRSELTTLMDSASRMDRASGADTIRTPKRRVLVGLGVAIAAVTGTALVPGARAADAAGTDPGLPPNPTVTIGEAVVLERGGTQGPRTEQTPVAPSVEIGEAVVVERNPDGSPGPQRTR